MISKPDDGFSFQFLVWHDSEEHLVRQELVQDRIGHDCAFNLKPNCKFLNIVQKLTNSNRLLQQDSTIFLIQIFARSIPS